MQFKGFMMTLGRKFLGLPPQGPGAAWRFKAGKQGRFHLFPPSDEDSPGTRCPECDGPEEERPLWSDCPEHQTKCETCGVLRKDCVPLLYVGQEPFLRAKCASEKGCRGLLGAWWDRQSWLRQPPGELPAVQTEAWHGKWSREQSDFFDREAVYLLPLACPVCCSAPKVYCGADLKLPFYAQAKDCDWDPETQIYSTDCGRCAGPMSATKAELSVWGSPRNVALEIHGDGFQAADTINKSAFVLDVLPTCVPKQERSQSANA